MITDLHPNHRFFLYKLIVFTVLILSDYHLCTSLYMRVWLYVLCFFLVLLIFIVVVYLDQICICYVAFGNWLTEELKSEEKLNFELYAVNLVSSDIYTHTRDCRSDLKVILVKFSRIQLAMYLCYRWFYLNLVLTIFVFGGRFALKWRGRTCGME